MHLYVTMLRQRRQNDLYKFVKLVTFSYNAGRYAATGFSPFLLDGFETNHLINLALVLPVSDRDVVERLKITLKIRQNLPKLKSGA